MGRRKPFIHRTSFIATNGADTSAGPFPVPAGELRYVICGPQTEIVAPVRIAVRLRPSDELAFQATILTGWTRTPDGAAGTGRLFDFMAIPIGKRAQINITARNDTGADIPMTISYMGWRE